VSRPAASAAPAAAPARPALGRTLLELVWPSTGAHVAQADSIREVVETIVFVVVLVLLLKSFAAEAFVIPTGSMAETLWGYQKVVVCPRCKFQFPVNCSSEVDPQEGQHLPVTSCTCPNCRYSIEFTVEQEGKVESVTDTELWLRVENNGPNKFTLNAKTAVTLDGKQSKPEDLRAGNQVHVVFRLGDLTATDVEASARGAPEGKARGYNPYLDSGDRVLVAKSLYELGLMHPERRDVVVFKFPGDDRFPESGPQHLHVPMNYIKRLIGLGGETIGIYYGKLYVMYGDEPSAEDRAAPQEDLWQHRFMHEDKFREELQDIDKTDPGKRRFQLLRKRPDKILALKRPVYDNDHPADDLAGQPRWAAEKGGGWAADQANGFVLTPGQGAGLDWVRYSHLLRSASGDANPPRPQLITDFMGYNAYESGRHPQAPDQNWVGDLILECEVAVDQPAGEFVLELSKGVDRFRARFDLKNGTCTLLRVRGDKEEELEKDRPVGLKAGTHQVRFANVDDRLTVWVDGSLPFGDGVAYDPPGQRGPTKENDLQPASIGARGAGVRVHRIKLWRDTYYTLDPRRCDADQAGRRLSGDDWADPGSWDVLKHLPAKTLYVQPNHFLCLGDNSPESSDGRSWGTVPERLMLGRALLVYYPFYFPYPPLSSPVNRVGPIR
jgi:signal peptidase I